MNEVGSEQDEPFVMGEVRVAESPAFQKARAHFSRHEIIRKNERIDVQKKHEQGEFKPIRQISDGGFADRWENHRTFDDEVPGKTDFIKNSRHNLLKAEGNAPHVPIHRMNCGNREGQDHCE